jgi:site-specific DNA-methyltransferase (adenine-specific)
MLPFANTDSRNSAGAFGHGAGTPYKLAEWWARYICPPGGVMADWCMGVGTMGLAAANTGRSFIGIERDAAYFAIAQERIAAAYAPLAAILENTVRELGW